MADVLSRLHKRKRGRGWVPPRLESLPSSPPDSDASFSDDEFDDDESEAEGTSAMTDTPSKLLT